MKFMLVAILCTLRLSSCMDGDYTSLRGNSFEMLNFSTPASSRGMEARGKVEHFGIRKKKGKTLDISEPTELVFRLYEFEYDDVTTKMFLAKRESNVRRVVDGKNLIWESDRNYVCTQVMIHMDYHGPSLAQLTLESNHDIIMPRLRNIFGSWESTPYFTELFWGLKVPSILNVKFTIDIWARTDTMHMNVLEYDIYRVPSIVMVPRSGHNSGKVVEMRSKIWKSKKGKRILCVKLHPADDPILLHIVATNAASVVKNRYFNKVSRGSWVAINKYGYSRILMNDLRARVIGQASIPSLDEEDEEKEEEVTPKYDPPLIIL